MKKNIFSVHFKLKTEYSLDGGNWQEYTQPFTLTQQGSTTVLYRSVDNVNNQEHDKTIEFKIDKTGPGIARFLSAGGYERRL